jgi:hypothetical protein
VTRGNFSWQRGQIAILAAAGIFFREIFFEKPQIRTDQFNAHFLAPFAASGVLKGFFCRTSVSDGPQDPPEEDRSSASLFS